MIYAYFMLDESRSLIKIGQSGNLDRRLYLLSNAVGAKLVLLGVTAKVAEKDLHQRLTAHRVHGEWFRDCPEVHTVVNEYAEPLPPHERKVRFMMDVDREHRQAFKLLAAKLGIEPNQLFAQMVGERCKEEIRDVKKRWNK